MALFESCQGQCRIATDPIFLEQVIQDMGESISRSLENPSHVVFFDFLLTNFVLHFFYSSGHSGVCRSHGGRSEFATTFLCLYGF